MRDLQDRLARAGDARFRLPPGADAAPDPAELAGAGAELSVMAKLSLHVGRLVQEMAAARIRAERMSAIGFVPMITLSVAVSGGQALLAGNEAGPRTGYGWAVQRMTIAGLAGTDTMTLYKGPVPTPLNLPQPQNLVGNPLTVAAPNFHPGGKGLLLQHGDFLSAFGTGLTAAAVTLSADVIQFEADLLSAFLI
jgi:hypothetical protein